MTAGDHGRAADSLGVAAGTVLAEGGHGQGAFHVEKFDLDQTLWVSRRLGVARPQGRHFEAARVRPFDIYDKQDANLITNAGWNLLLKGKTLLSTDSAPTIWFDATHGAIGAGTSTTAPTATDTALNANALTGNNWTLCGVAPTVTSSARTAIFTATFALGDGIGTWQEFAIDQSTTTRAATTSTAPMINHGLATPGTKTGSQTWNVTVTLTFT